MKWLLAGLLFALAVGLAIGTVAIRAGNTALRHEVERTYREIEDRYGELKRLSIERAERTTPEHMAAAMWVHLRAEQQRRLENLQ
jgi:uncharacterized membrane-anchored protein YhcB (DUF1043 family)